MRSNIILLIAILFLLSSLSPKIFASPITNIAPTPYSTYHSGDSYTTIYRPSEIAPPNATKPPIITITAPATNTLIASNNLTLTFSLTLEAPTTYYPIILQGLCYKPSWQSDNITIDFGSNNKFYNKTLAFSISFTNMTDGAKSVTIYANTLYENETKQEEVSEPISGIEGLQPYGNYLYVYSNYYFMEGYSSVEFAIDTAPTASPSQTPGNIPLNTGRETISIAIILITMTIAVASLIIYIKHQKKRTKML